MNRMKVTSTGNSRGRTVAQLPLLLAEGRTPLSVPRLLQRRLETQRTGVGRAWLNNHFTTTDAVVYHPDGRLKIIKYDDSLLLRLLL